jgi:hypothetical protein
VNSNKDKSYVDRNATLLAAKPAQRPRLINSVRNSIYRCAIGPRILGSDWDPSSLSAFITRRYHLFF